ncbi:hypothetical protein PN36_19170 [Candidatus Thiomargarita nelsonii]|uniref:Uncharacterized protein n=1 Tax=Candidatus Thiomargarita nelsonii TaxID=1003181 RepID=A0A0A6PDA2_9GAMM|nr:hypothetical protein PN36_19170 [Candidatus Thiomargarita nelsonii]
MGFLGGKLTSKMCVGAPYAPYVRFLLSKNEMKKSEPIMIHPDVLTPEEVAYSRQPEVIRQNLRNADKSRKFMIESHSKIFTKAGNVRK